MDTDEEQRLLWEAWDAFEIAWGARGLSPYRPDPLQSQACAQILKLSKVGKNAREILRDWEAGRSSGKGPGEDQGGGEGRGQHPLQQPVHDAPERLGSLPGAAGGERAVHQPVPGDGD